MLGLFRNVERREVRDYVFFEMTSCQNAVYIL